MIGLEFICRTFQVEFKEVAEKLNIKPQTINSWLREKRKIPKERLNQLSDLFGIKQEEYFQKELTRAEQIEIKKLHLRKTDKSYEIEIPNVDEEGNEYLVSRTYSENEEYFIFLDRVHETELLLEEIRELISDDAEQIDIDRLKVFQNVTKVLQSDSQKTKILDAVLFYLVDIMRVGVWGIKPRYEKLAKMGFFKKFGELLKELKLL